MDNEIAVALITGAVTVITALITAYVSTHKGGSRTESREIAINEATRRHDVRGVELRGNVRRIRFRTSTGKLFLRAFLSVLIVAGLFAIGTIFEPRDQEPLYFVLIGSILLFALIAVITLFRLIYRFFWTVFVE